MKKQLLKFLLIVSGCFFVYAELGQSGQVAGTINLGSDTSGIKGILTMAQDVLNRLVPILIGMAVLAFFWFLVIFVWKAKDNPEEQIKSRSGMGYSILAIFVMVSIWGIISLIGNIFGIGQGGFAPPFKVPGEL